MSPSELEPCNPRSPAARHRITLRGTFERLAQSRGFATLGRRLAPLDSLLYRASRGRLTVLGPQGAAMPPTLLLTTIGRRSGKLRSTPVMYLRDGPNLVITSESFGQRHPAAWPLNLDADGNATVQVGGQIVRCRARRATQAELGRLWPQFVCIWPAHETYLARNGVRNMFILEPRSDVETP
jgi:deazaflavin-dependent oxidoreductase (nitroreductase family)